MLKFHKIIFAVLCLFLFTLMGCDHSEKSTSQKNEVAAKDINASATNSDSAQNGDTETTNQSSSDTPSDSQNSNNDDQSSSQNGDSSPSSSQSNSVKPPAPSVKPINMESVTAVRIADPNTGWTGGIGWIAKTTNGGKKWSVQYKGSQTVHQIFALNSQKVWATMSTKSDQSSNFKLYKSNDGGSHWAVLSTVPNNGFLHFISDTIALSANYVSKDGGKTWGTLPIPRNIVGDAYFHDLKNGWAAAQGKGEFYIEKTNNGGKSWQVVMTKKVSSPITGSVIRSAGTTDAWVEVVGDSGMSQTSYSLFHTTDGGSHWQTVIANSTAGGGPAPGFSMDDTKLPHNNGAKPDALYVVNTKTAFMNGQCPACDQPNTLGWTNDGGKTWINGKTELSGFGPNLLAFADSNHGWWITTENGKPSIMYASSNGGKDWAKVYTFK